MELRGVRNKENFVGEKESSGKKYILECMLSQLTLLFSHLF